MLKIGTVKWKGRCGKHQGYDPEQDGEGGIRGGCGRCRLLLDIFQHHIRLVRAMREFGASDERQKSLRNKTQAEIQPMLFDMADLGQTRDTSPNQRGFRNAQSRHDR